MCDRCYTAGSTCNYSPSSRAGKPKSDTGSRAGSSTSRYMPAFPSRHNNTSFLNPLSHPHFFRFGSPDGLGAPGRPDPNANGACIYTPPEPSFSLHGPSHAFFGNTPSTDEQLALGAQSYDVSMAACYPDGSESTTQSMLYYAQAAQSSAQFPTPGSSMSSYHLNLLATPDLHPVQESPSGRPTGALASSCTCFIVCLQSLHALWQTLSLASPTVQHIRAQNRRAIEGCASTMACARCMSRPEIHTIAMMLTSIMDLTLSLYQNASRMVSRAENAASAATSPSSAGAEAYPGANGTEGLSSEALSLTHDVWRICELYNWFKELWQGLSEDPNLSDAVIQNLGNSLQSTLLLLANGGDDSVYT